jgi:cell division protein FtsI/penicillin-binding protein 2
MTTASSLDRAIPDSDVNFVVIDAASRSVLALRWVDAETPVPVGSLVKPFTSLAFSRSYPELDCRGAANSCWSPKPHGHLHFPEALALSCNAYFLQLAAMVKGQALAQTTAAFGIPPPAHETPEARIGLGDRWRISPVALVRAYLELAARRGNPQVDPILRGLELAARAGTASEIGRGLPGSSILAKTGTAACVSKRRHAGDGFTVAIYPAQSPQFGVLVRVHDVPGAQAARAAALVLQTLQNIR